MSHLTEEDLKYSEFFFKHKETIRRFLLFTLFFLDLIIVFNLALRFLVYNRTLLSSLQVEKGLTTEYIPYAQVHAKLAPDPLRIEAVNLIPAGQQNYDLLLSIRNPNDRWLAKDAQVKIFLDNQEKGTQEIFIMPGASAKIMFFGLSSASAQPVARAVIDQPGWSRVRDVSALDILPQLEISPPRFINLGPGGFRVESSLINNSAYGFWTLGVQAIVWAGETPIGINYFSLERVTSGSDRDINLAWPRALPGATAVSLIPVINIFDENVYLPVIGGQDSGDPSGVD